MRERVDFDGACPTAARKSLWCISARVREVTGCEPTWSWLACRHRYTHDVSPWPSYHDPRRLLLAVSCGRSRDHTPPGRWVGKRERLLISETHRWRCVLAIKCRHAGWERTAMSALDLLPKYTHTSRKPTTCISTGDGMACRHFRYFRCRSPLVRTGSYGGHPMDRSRRALAHRKGAGSTYSPFHGAAGCCARRGAASLWQ